MLNSLILNPKKQVSRPDSFGIKDWECAMGMLGKLGWELEVIELEKGRIEKKIESSYLNF